MTYTSLKIKIALTKMPIEKEKNQFEQIIQAEVSDMALDGLVGIDDASEKVSEVVGESTGENIPVVTNKKKTKTGFAAISSAISNLLHPPKKKISKILPTVVIQKQETKKALVKQTRKLISQATKLQNSKNYSADKMETLIQEIRYLQGILASMFSYTAEKIEKLYRQFVLKEI